MKLKKIIAGTAIIIVFFFIGTKKVEGASPTVCGSLGQPCCQGESGESPYCYNNRKCDSKSGMCTSEQAEDYCGDVDQLCCPGNTCNENLKCDNGRCRIVPQSTDAILPKYSADTGFRWANASLGEIISELIKYVYLFAGLALIIVLLFGGFTVLTAAGVPEKAQVGYTRITQGLIGFVVIFASYLVVFLVEAILKINIF